MPSKLILKASPLIYPHQVVLLTLISIDVEFDYSWNSFRSENEYEIELTNLSKEKIKGSEKIINWLKPDLSKEILTLSKNIYIRFYSTLNSYISFYGSENFEKAKLSLGSAKNLLRNFAISDKYSYEAKFICLMPCLFSLKAVSSYASIKELRTFFQENYETASFRRYFDLVQSFKRSDVTPNLTKKEYEILEKMSIEANNRWIDDDRKS